ncbi:MAG TPA: L-lactate permease [Thermoflexia bacterium]|jgi:lactate permease|nr:L-lactate permease [Thermoflexia bacterium]
MIIDWLLALTPILVILVLMLGFRWKGVQAGPVGWLAATLIAAFRFGAGWEVLLWAQVKALFLALWVLYIVWAALLFYRVTDEAGAITTIGAALARLTTDRALQALLVGWVFAAFLQGVSGFGVPVAVVGPLLVGLGFPAVAAVVIASVGHSWAVTFGSLSSSFYALMAATGRSGEELAAPCAVLLWVACFLCGAGALWAAGGWRTVREEWGPLLVLGTAMGGTQYLVVTHGLWPIGAMSGGLAGLGVGVLWARWRVRGTASPRPANDLPIDLRWAVAPYGLLVAIILLARLVGPVETFLGQVVIRVEVPELVTARGWVTPAGATRSINLFGHAGALLTYASLLTYGLFRWKGAYRPGVVRRIARDVVRRGVPSGVGIATMVGMAVTMDHAGMIHLLAEGIARAVGPAFPLASPFIGALGAFMTGSNTNSNVVFGALQERVAALVGMSPLLALAAQTAGGAIGGMFAPAKVIVGCAPVEADEGATMRKTMTYGMVILGTLGGVVAVMGWLRLL